MQYIDDETGIIRAYLQEAAKCESNASQFKQKAAQQMVRPFMILRPDLYPDGDKWCALYGNNIQDGVCGFGETPEQAALAFDKAWIGHHENEVNYDVS